MTFGWFQELVVERGPVFAPGERLTLGKVTLLEGGNGSGKTALCDWIVGAADPFTLHRWWRDGSRTPELQYSVRYHAPEEKTVKVEVTREAIRFCDPGSALSLSSPVPFKMITIREPHLQGSDYRRDGEDDLALLSRLLHIDSSVVWNALTALNRFGAGKVRNARLQTDDDSTSHSLYLDVKDTKPGLAYIALSHGEKARVHLEIALVVATMTAQYFPTMLLLDGWMAHLPPDEIIHYARMLSATERPFQSIIVHWDLASCRDRSVDAEFVRLVAGPNGTRIEQTIARLPESLAGLETRAVDRPLDPAGADGA